MKLLKTNSIENKEKLRQYIGKCIVCSCCNHIFELEESDLNKVTITDTFINYVCKKYYAKRFVNYYCPICHTKLLLIEYRNELFKDGSSSKEVIISYLFNKPENYEVADDN